MISVAVAEKDLDLRDTAPAERIPRALAAFDALAAGETVVLLAADPASDVLRRLQAQRSGLFEWSLLAAGPPAWRIELARRAETGAPRRGVSEALSWDHDRLDSLEQTAFRKRGAGELRGAAELYAAFAAGLRRHIGFEEEILFPAFEERTGFPPMAGPTAVMRVEHREIQDLLQRIEAGIGDPAAPVEELRRRFYAVLGDHNVKEEEILYPGTDEILGAEDADRLVSRIQRY